MKIGAGAMVGARSGVLSDLKAGGTYSEMPARPFKQQQKIKALVQRLPKLVERVKRLEAERDQKPEARD